MSRAPSTFKQRDVKAAIKAAVAAGVEVARLIFKGRFKTPVRRYHSAAQVYFVG